MVNTIVEHCSITLTQLLIISSRKSLSWYISYRDASIAIRIVSWGEHIIAALIRTTSHLKLTLAQACWLGGDRGESLSLLLSSLSGSDTLSTITYSIQGFQISHVMRLWHFSSSVFIFQTYMHNHPVGLECMHTHPVGLDVWFLVRPFIYFHTSCVWTTNTLVRLRGCAGLPEPLLVTYVITTIISWAGSFNVFKLSPF